ncbi:MAG: hypothetical protein Q9161_002725 [Pseudevernia consocians]
MDIEKTNRIRASLGMTLLPVPCSGPQFKDSKATGSSSEEDKEKGSTLESRQAYGYENWNKLQKEADAKAQRQAKTDDGFVENVKDERESFESEQIYPEMVSGRGKYEPRHVIR